MFLTTITDALLNSTRTIVSFIPQLIGAIVLIILGIIIASIIRAILRGILKRINFDQLLEKTGLLSTMKSGGIQLDPAEIITGLVYWFIFIIFIIAATNSLELPVLTSILNKIYLYIPQVIGALLIFFIGIFVAQFIGNMIMDMQVLGKIEYSQILGNAIKWIIILFAVLAALEELSIAPQLVTILFGSIIISISAGIGLAIGLSFGLGGRDSASQITENIRELIVQKNKNTPKNRR